jgi:hypothetical protein
VVPSSLPQGLDVPRVEAVKPAENPSLQPGAVVGIPTPTALPGDVAVAAKTDPAQGPAVVPTQGPTILQRSTDERSEDPEKAALSFVEQNQKMAESQLVMLRAEEARLRARLQKVEAGIKRWDSLLGALKQSQGTVAVMIPDGPQGWKQAGSSERDSEPQHLDPIPRSNLKASDAIKK